MRVTARYLNASTAGLLVSGRVGAEAFERSACVHRQDNSDCETRRENQRRRAVAELIDVPQDLARLIGRASSLDCRTTAKRGNRPEQFEET